MSKQKEMIALIKTISGQANVLTIPRVFIDIAGDHLSALFLSQCIYWSDKGRDGWFYKSEKEWHEELGLSPFQIKRVRENLVNLSFIETKLKRANAAPTMHYRVDFGLLTNSIIEKLNNRETQQSDYAVSQQSDYEETQQSLTEITQEITTEIDENEKRRHLSSKFWTASKIPEPSPGGRGWNDWQDGLDDLLKIKATVDEIEPAILKLDEIGYGYTGPGSIVKTILNNRKAPIRKQTKKDCARPMPKGL